MAQNSGNFVLLPQQLQQPSVHDNFASWHHKRVDVVWLIDNNKFPLQALSSDTKV